MPITEVLNALLITYVATEYSLLSSSYSKPKPKKKHENNTCHHNNDNNDYYKYSSSFPQTFLSDRHNQIILATVLTVNLVDKLLLAESAAAIFIKQFLERLLHVPKVVLAALLYIIVLYMDCLRHLSATATATATAKAVTTKKNACQILPIRRFLRCVGVKFLIILPVYPFLAVLISFFFMVVISLLEHLHLPLQWLNWPIYYMVLYGPFSLVYLQVKETIIEEERTRTYNCTSTTSVFTTASSSRMSSTSSKNNGTTFLRSMRLAHFDAGRSCTTNEEILSYNGEYISFHEDDYDDNDDVV